MLRIVAALAALSAASASGLVATVRMEPVVDSPCVDNVKQYAGYVDVSDKWDSHYFAWLSESRSNPSTDPLIVWLSGGPGCSSSLAMLTENGPCTAKADGSGTTRNPYGWNTKANLMYVDQPAGVGFSYADRGGYSHNESQVGEYMVAFFTGFYKKYPQYANNPLYMACESYGGHYCPSATYALFESNKNAGTNFPIKGMAIGNGLVDPASQYPTYPKFVEDQCTKEIGKPCVDKSGYESMVAASPTCSKLIAQCQSDDSACPTAQSYCNNAMFGPYEATNMNPYDIRIPCEVPPLCYDFSGVATFLNNPATQKAIGVNGITWASCNYEVNGDFSADWMKNMAWKVPPLLKAGIPAWVYAGEDDFIVQWLGNQAWTEALPWPGAKAYNQTTLQPWTSGGKVAGAHRSYGGLSFTTVANAGHMAPRDQPEATLTMINAFISGQPLPSE
ncbi:hypothetical protein FNF27_02831 [Cafeteria roenbergensis]|uniref:Carboxypeptidase n=1 Tax=Cafeteria roenbergensis TaxID=33653 RepID=A0A5A8CMP8_CAFRO|nr:hypothetical protein FNF29_03207 [Cafeteria roenbergensis]KAA0161103.1 hypothetical protein FNF31_03944 [Cafeteria roenbergensis]KAA0175745.1 hypothetical protein FNF27_02831 [Cafeteria roenbergensis]|eukprot:KAA0153390.1 hypothetical protein FNF29_03207 [Cafeteria roenbergensis]